MANAAGMLRSGATTTSCAPGTVGLDGSTTGKNGVTPLGDLATIVCSYDTTAGYSSNSLSSYFHDLGHRERAYDLVQDWLATKYLPNNNQSLGGNYGEKTPTDLGYTLTSADGHSCAAQVDTPPQFYVIV